MSELMLKLKKLFELQLIDSELMEAIRELKRIEKNVSPVAQKHQKISAQLAAIEEEVKPARGDVKKLQDEIAVLNEKKKAVEDKLFTAGVDPKELQYLQKDRDQIAGLVKKCEDQITKNMIRIDGAELKSREINAQLAAIDVEFKKESGESNAKRETLTTRIEELRKNRAEFRSFKDKELLATYQKLQRQNDGMAIVTVSNGVCDGCFVEVSKATSTHLRTSDNIVTCQRCGCMIYDESAID
jgi:uncharacterized protein